MSFFESKLINLNGNVTGKLPVANGGPQMPTVDCYVYVSDTGSDVTGNGTYNNPFATTAAALAIITDASTTKRYGVHIKGTIAETNIYLKPYVWYYGDSWGLSRLNATGGNITLSPGAFATGNSRCGIYNVYLVGSTGINLDFVAQTASGSHVIEMTTLGVNGSVTSNPNNTNQYYQWEGDSLVFGNMTLHGALGLIFNTFLIGNLTVDQMSVAQATGGVNFANFFIGGNVTHSTSGSFANPIQMTACTITGTLGITGTGATLTADAISLPLKAQITLSTGGAITRTTDVNALAYSPTTAGNWNSAPTTDQAALDTLATSGVVKSQTQNLVLASPNGSSGVPTFRALVAADVALASSTNALASASTTINVSSATAPTSGQVLTATSPTAATWQNPVTSVATSTTAGIVTSYTPLIVSGVKTISSANYTILDADGFETFLITTGSSARTLTLPTAANNAGRSFKVVKMDSGTGQVQIVGTINGSSSSTIYNALNYQYGTCTIYCDGTNYSYTVQPTETGFYTPTITNVANTNTLSAGTDTSFSRVGTRVMVCGAFNLNNAGGTLILTLSLPITPTAFATSALAAGTGGSNVNNTVWYAFPTNAGTTVSFSTVGAMNNGAAVFYTIQYNL